MSSVLSGRGGLGSAFEGLDADFAVRLSNFVQAAPKPLTINSGYRSVERQAQLYKAALEKYGTPEAARKWVAPPGRSNHNHGLAADLGFGGKSLGSGDPELIKWAHENAGAYGLTFPLANENWHIEPVGARDTSHTRDGGAMASAANGPWSSAGAPGMSGVPGAPADLHSPMGYLASDNPSERRGMLSGLQDYSINSFLADQFAGVNPLRRAFFSKVAGIFA